MTGVPTKLSCTPSRLHSSLQMISPLEAKVERQIVVLGTANTVLFPCRTRIPALCVIPFYCRLACVSEELEDIPCTKVHLLIR